MKRVADSLDVEVDDAMLVKVLRADQAYKSEISVRCVRCRYEGAHMKRETEREAYINGDKRRILRHLSKIEDDAVCEVDDGSRLRVVSYDSIVTLAACARDSQHEITEEEAHTHRYTTRR